VYLDGRVVAFDGIEFDPRLRWIDVMSDAAFLLMDLESRGRPELGWRFFDAWLERNGDYDGLAVLPWYLVYRHLVRAKVDAIRIGQAGLAAAESARLEQRLNRHLGLAGGWSGARRPLAVLMTGYSGSGKSHLAARLAPELGAVRVRSDVERKRLHGLAAEADASAAPGAGLYSQGATHRTYARLEAVMRTALGSGLDVVVDAAFLDAERRTRFVGAARSAGGTPVWLECTAPVEVLFSRIASRHGDPSDAGVGILEAQLARGVAPDGDDAPRRVVDTHAGVDAKALATSLAALRRPA
jgi:predicted kinase